MRARWPVIALSLVLVVLGIFGCNDDNTTTNPAPALTATITANPNSPTTGSVVTLTATPSPAGTYTITWTADGGSFARTDTTTTTWTAPDADGTYKITAIIGDGTKAASAAKSIVVANYVPAVNPHYVGAKTCDGCHATHGDTYAEWSGTAHAGALASLEEIGMGSSPFCIGCHTVGYDTNVANGGYDEQMVPRLANVQCESCHGPASDHVGAGGGSTGITIEKSAALCGTCHEGEHHPTYSEWSGSPHARLVYEGPGETPATIVGCAKCHNGNISMAYLDAPVNFPNPTQEAANDTSLAVACVVCHDPHGNGNPRQLRMASVTDVALPDGTTPAIGAGRLCIACHNGRRAPTSIEGQINNGSAHFGPHHSNQGDMLAGVDGYNNVNPNFRYATGRHVTVQDGCINCHNHHRQEQLPFFTGHNFAPTPEACAFCHGQVNDFDDIKAKEDYDGNGSVDGMQTEVVGLMDTLATTIIRFSRDDTRRQQLQAAYDGGTFSTAIGDTSISSRTQRMAGYNYFFVQYDASEGVHNATYAIQLLQQSVLALHPAGLTRAKVLVE